jgi:copper chaperone CopZ
MTQSDSQETGRAIFSLHNLGSSSCSSQVDIKLGKIRGVVEVNVNYVADTVEVQFNPAKVTAEEIRAFIKKLEHNSAQSH